MKKDLDKKLRYLPDSPGVYLMKDKTGEIIYVGKALQLNKRVKSYFTSTISSPANYSVSNAIDGYRSKTDSMANQVADIDYIITTTEEEAFLLEANLIKKHKPKYNISLKDDKRYPFIKLTLNDPFPRLLVVRELRKDGSRYFGPYADAAVIRKIMRYVEWILPIRTCSKSIDPDKKLYEKPCLNHQLGKCPAPCIGAVTKEDYRKTINLVISFLLGRDREILESLKEDMYEAGKVLNFEKAAKLRDRLATLERITKNRTIHFPNEENRDVIAIYKEDKLTAVSVLKILSGKLLNSENHRFSNAENGSKEEILAAFISQYYSDKTDDLPQKIMLSEKPVGFETLNRWLKNRLIIPQKGDNRLLMNIALKNAFNFIETIKLSHLRKTDRTVFPVQELKERLNLVKLPRKIICIDVSTIGGTDTVSSIVYYENGKPSKKRYRRFIIKNSEIQNDYAAIEETLHRYLVKVEEDDIPDLIVIDGGKGQLNAAWKVLEQLRDNKSEKDLTIPVISLAKKAEQIFTLDSSNPIIILPRSSSALRLLVSIRDEAHRFAITYHRLKRSKRTIASELDRIKGVGNDTKFRLLKSLGSVENIKNAGIEELTSIKGIGKKTAQLIKDGLTDNK